MKSVLISIQPKWCELIASGKKTVEVRKTKPKLETPFKVYIYMTKNFSRGINSSFYYYKSGKVIGEFVCDFITNYEAELWDDETYERIQEFYEPDDFNEYGEYEYQTLADNSDDFWKEQHLCKVSCLSIEELRKYIGLGINEFYGWHISNLVIYNKPRELSKFITPTDCNSKVAKDMMCNTCCLSSNFCSKKPKRITKPPQSWCYVESEVDTE